MKWFFKWIQSGLRNIERDDEREMVEEKYRQEKYRSSPGLAINIPKIKSKNIQAIGAMASGDNVHLNQQPMHFKIYPATGGHIVEYSYYNEKQDENHQALHLVPSELDLGTELAKIMTLEALKR